ncbi:MAG: CsgG/HfaB family protein [Desulfobacterota bacterium]|jgi:TolB-like protein|nr:CsgG/HfaB family protein [Thermodesulfobacteriota bacterium]
MKKSLIVFCTGSLLFVASSLLQAGQVITDAERQWAAKAVQQEQTMEAAPAANTVAVLAFQNRSTNPELTPLQKGFAFLLMTDLAQVQGINVVERIRLQALLEELDLGASGLVEEQTGPRLGKLLGAGYLVGGDLTSDTRAQLGILSDVLQVRDQNSLGRASADGSLEQVLDMEKKILFEVVDLLKIKLTKPQREKLSRPLTTNYQALLYLSCGLDASDRGNYSQAGFCYGKALEKDPQFTPARTALNELASLKLITINPRSQAILESQEEQNSSTLSLEKNNATFREFRPATTGQIHVGW